jgi:hypothetical protein
MVLPRLRWFGWCLLGAWCLAITHLVPIPSTTIAGLYASYQVPSDGVKGQSKSEQLSREDIERQVRFVGRKVWIGWILKFGLVVGGFAAAVLTLSSSRTWPLLVATTSSVYLYVWIEGYPTVAEGTDISWLSWLNVTLSTGDITTILIVLSQDLVLPLFHLVAVLTVIIYARLPPLEAST